MNPDTRREAREGIAFGLITGVVFAAVEMAAAAGAGESPIMPLRMFASVVLGREGLSPVTPDGTAALVGGVTHLALSALFGVIYGVFNARLTPRTQTHWLRESLIGVLYGAGLYLVNIQLIARVAYPWFLEQPQLPSLLAHAFLFGLPLGLLFAKAERRVRRVVAHA
jgi:hypothetical protein